MINSGPFESKPQSLHELWNPWDTNFGPSVNSRIPVVEASGLLWDLGLVESQLWSFCGLLDHRSTQTADLQPNSMWQFGAMCYDLDIKCLLQAHGSEHLFLAILLLGSMRPRR